MGTKDTLCLLLVGFAILNCFDLSSCKVLDTIYKWRYIDFLWGSEKEANAALASGLYNPSVVAPYDVDVHYSKETGFRVFIALEGREGVPATLTTVSNFATDAGPLLKPYPDWSWFNKNCSSIVSVYRVAIDECDRLWVLDAGSNDCPSKLLSFDLLTDKLIQSVILPSDVSANKAGLSMLTNPIVETSGPNCQNTAVYIADSAGEGLIVYNNGYLARMEHPTFKHEPKDTFFESGPHKINFTAGLLGMSISPKLFPGESRYLYYRPLVSRSLYAVNTEYVRNLRPGQHLPVGGIENVLSSPAVGQAFSSEGTLFLGMTKETSIVCWNRYRPLNDRNFVTVDRDVETLNYSNGMKVAKRPGTNNEDLWVLSNRFIGFLQGELDFNNEYNFYVLMKPVRELIEGTNCDMPPDFKGRLASISSRTNSRSDRWSNQPMYG